MMSYNLPLCLTNRVFIILNRTSKAVSTKGLNTCAGTVSAAGCPIRMHLVRISFRISFDASSTTFQRRSYQAPYRAVGPLATRDAHPEPIDPLRRPPGLATRLVQRSDCH